MLTPIDPKYLLTDTAIRRDIDQMIAVCGGREDMTVVVGEEGENPPVTVTLNMPDNPSLDGLTIWTAAHSDGRWWKTASDRRFMP